MIEEEPVTKKPRKILKYEDSYLRSIPKAMQYEKSFMHRDLITHVIATERDFVITASQDGHLKFWKKKHNQGIEFVKHFRCHLKEFSDIAINHNGVLMATCCKHDKSVKSESGLLVHKGSDLYNALAVSDADSGRITILDGKGANSAIHVIESMHLKPVIMIHYSAAVDVAISVDESGMIEYWSGVKNNFEFPASSVGWEYKTDTDLYEFLKLKQLPACLKISPNGQTFAIIASDRRVYVFDLRSAKIVKKLDESLQRYIELGKETKGFGLQNMEWNRRVALEREMSRDPAAFRYLKIGYDESSNFLYFPTPIGIKVYNLVTDEVVREIGKGAATSMDVEAAENPNLKNTEPDPMIIACGYKRNQGGPSRDVFNEKPTKEDVITSVSEDAPQTKLCDHATIHTTYGDIHVELYPDKCPKTVENFCTHARYYNGHTFHRVIKSFMIQTGDPSGKGTGGQSIWGDDFEDEFHPLLRHDKPFRLSMANAGPNTNGSQFFITVVPAEWLDGKNTLFGQVTEGFNVVQKINQAPAFEKSGRPREEIGIISISLKNN
uniref:peptidylprolyl isomerase n=1 Tax=Ditylenchus dipsaci TaxID=166011 RepID=A0A915CQU2_9BILA